MDYSKLPTELQRVLVDTPVDRHASIILVWRELHRESPKGILWTPRKYHSDSDRYSLRISPEDYIRLKNAGRRGRWIRVRDIRTAKRYRARTAACSIPGCHCDAVAEELSPRGRRLVRPKHRS